jgi:hypothetical protein
VFAVFAQMALYSVYCLRKKPPTTSIAPEKAIGMPDYATCSTVPTSQSEGCCSSCSSCCCCCCGGTTSVATAPHKVIEMGPPSSYPPPQQIPIHNAAWGAPPPTYGAPPSNPAPAAWGAPPTAQAGAPPSNAGQAWGAPPATYGGPPTDVPAWGSTPVATATPSYGPSSPSYPSSGPPAVVVPPTALPAWGAPSPSQPYAAVPQQSPNMSQASPVVATPVTPVGELVSVVIPFGSAPGSMVQCTTHSGAVVRQNSLHALPVPSLRLCTASGALYRPSWCSDGLNHTSSSDHIDRAAGAQCLEQHRS